MARISVSLFLWVVLRAANGFIELEKPHTCIIGAGYSGLATARHLQQYGLNFTVFERTKDIGGTWRFDPNVGVDEDGVPVSTSQYKYLRTNSPRESMAFTEFAFPESTPTFPTGTCFYKYIKSFAKHFHLLPYVQLRSYVVSVKLANKQWELLYYRPHYRETKTVFCDYVVIATGQYIKPHIPNFNGINDFKGSIIHSHDYKYPELYKNRKVLLVGAGPSGLDLALQLSNITTKLVHSHHLEYNEPYFSKSYIKKPDIKAFVSNGVIFKDMTSEDVEHVIFATGFNRDYPFLDESSALIVTPHFVLPLHNQIVNIRRPTMLFVGVVKHFMNRILDAQAEYIASLISGQFELPTQEEMLEKWLLDNGNKKLNDMHNIVPHVKKYIEDITGEANINRVPPVLVDLINFNGQNLLQNLLHYRDYEYRIIDPFNYTTEIIRNHTEERKQECPINDVNF